MRRRSPARRGPGLVNTMARTAVIAGTATAVSGSVSSSRSAKEQQQQAAAQKDADFAEMKQTIDSLQAQQVQQVVAPAPAQPAPAPAAGGSDLIAQLQQLGELHASGILNDDQFEAAKQKILGA
jgi:hypothetical protein